MTTTALLTPARRRALEVLAATHPRPGRYSNTTGQASGISRIHWQAADWLICEQLVTCVNELLRLTSAGVIACRAAGIEVRNA